MKTLYVTDLDGTLMRDDKTISRKSVAILNHLIAKGICLTYATARSVTSAKDITKDIAFELPAITRNGTILANPQTMEAIEILAFGETELQVIKHLVSEFAIPGFVTTYLDGKKQKLYLAGRMNSGFDAYLKDRATDISIHMADTEEALFIGKVCYFTFIAEKKELEPLYERVKNHKTFNHIFQQDKYRTEYWLELCPQNATKAKAIQRVKELYGCDRVVVFGDSLNDVSMFRMADEAYAVNNAINELKEIATGTIEDNNADGVAKWLELNA